MSTSWQAQHKVYVIWSNPIFRDALHMLMRKGSFDWVGSATDIDQALEEIWQIKPDTVVIENSRGNILDDLIEKLESSEYRIQIICMNLDNNQAVLYRREVRFVIHEDELTDLILNP